MSERISYEEFERLQAAVLEFAIRLRGKDRHERGGTTLGEMYASDAFAEAWVSLLTDPEYIRREVAQNLERWLGERGGKYSDEGWLEREVLRVGIAKLGEAKRYEGGRQPTAVELGSRAARAPSMTEAKAEHRTNLLRENAKLCLDLADAFEERLQNEGGIRRVQ